MAKNPIPSTKFVTKKHQARLDRERNQNRILTIGAIVVIAAVVFLIGFGLLDRFVLRGNSAVATVNGDKITVNEFQKQVKYTRWQLIRQYEQYLQLAQFLGNDPTFLQNLQSIQNQLNDPASLGSSVLEIMIDDRLIAQEAEQLGLTVDEAEVDKSLKENFGFFENGTPTPAPTVTVLPTSTYTAEQLSLLPPTATPAEETEATPEEPTATLAPTEEEASGTPVPTATPYTLEGFQTELKTFVDELTAIGFTEQDIRDIIYRSLLRQKVMDAKTADVDPMQEQVWARHILVDEQGIAEALRERIIDGEDFAALAAEYSRDTSNASNGGDLGWFGMGRMVAEFEAAAFTLEVGEVSQPVQTSFGWHLIQVLGKENRPVDAETLDSMKATAFESWLTTQRSGEGVVINYTDNLIDIVPTEPAMPAELTQ